MRKVILIPQQIDPHLYLELKWQELRRTRQASSWPPAPQQSLVFPGLGLWRDQWAELSYPRQPCFPSVAKLVPIAFLQVRRLFKIVLYASANNRNETSAIRVLSEQ